MRRVSSGLATLMFAAMFLVVGLPKLRAQGTDGRNPASRQEMQDFRQFLTSHPWIADKLRENPSLANDRGFLHDNHELPEFLNAHPFIQSSVRNDAAGTMSRAQAGGGRGNPEEYRGMQDFQQFLSNHPWIADKLRQNPSLANDGGFLRDNHELPDFLNSHPYVKSQFRADPNGFMQRAQRSAAGGPGGGNYNPHASDYQSLNLFMQNHKWIADRLRENPSRATNSSFLNDNKELRDFLRAHPYLDEQFKRDARGTVDRALQPQGQYF